MGKDNKKKKKIMSNSAFAIAAACAVAFMLIVTIISVIMYRHRMSEVAGMVSSNAYETMDKYVIFISSDDSSDYWRLVYDEAKKAGAENGIYVDMLSDSLNSEYSSKELLALAINTDCDAILIEGSKEEELTSLLEEAENKKIPVIAMDSDCENEDRISFIGANSYSISKLYANELIEVLKEDTSVLILKNKDLDEERASIIINGIQESVNEKIDEDHDYKDRNVEFTVSDVDSTQAFSTEEFVRNIFLTEDLPDVIICLDELTTTCVYQALIDYNKVGSIELFGYYQSETIAQGIKQGVIRNTVTVDAREIGQGAIAALDEYFSTGHVSDYVSIDVELINKENVDEIMEGQDE